MEEPAEPTRGGLAERLARLRPRAPSAPAHRADEQALAAALGAERIAPGLLCLRQTRSETLPHGRYPPGLARQQAHALIEEMPGPPETWCFLDTETSGLAGGTGTWVFLFGAAWLRNGQLELEQYLLTRLDAEGLMLECIAASLAAASMLISYNGKSFDVPLVVTRSRLAGPRHLQGPGGLAQRLDDMAHLDLLHPVRRLFARPWPDCRLNTVESRLLAFDRGADLPGSEAPAAWLDWLRHGDISRLPAVVEHNRNDLVSLAALIPALADAQAHPLERGADSLAVARHLIRRGAERRARDLLERQVERDPSDCDARWLLGRLWRRAGNWSRAVQLWNAMAREQDPRALEALAKYYEHRCRDPRRALEYARRLPADPARDHRCRRLQGKLQPEDSCSGQRSLSLP